MIQGSRVNGKSQRCFEALLKQEIKNKTETYWVAVMISGSLEPHLNTDGYAGYYCPNFKTKTDCEKWIKRWNREHPGVWVEKKTHIDCDNESENVIYIKGINALGEKLIKVSNNKLISKWLKKTLTQLGVDYDGKNRVTE